MREIKEVILGRLDSQATTRSFSLCKHRLQIIALLLSVVPVSFAQQSQRDAGPASLPDPVAHWRFDLTAGPQIVEEKTGQLFQVEGMAYAAIGPAGPAIEFDGYTGGLHGDRISALVHPTNTTIVCWLQLNAYPWNDVPILDQQSFSGGKADGLFFGLDAEGHLLARVGPIASNRTVVSAGVLPLRAWTMVTLSIDAEGQIAFSIGGEPSALQTPSTAQATPVDAPVATANNLLIGHVRRPLLPGPSSMIHPQLPIEYSLEGALGELTVYRRVLTVPDIKYLVARADPKWLTPTPWPAFPRGEGNRGVFGAFYTTLHFDPLWDRSRRVGPDSDVVVRFEDSPIQLIFWQGNNYVPAWVTENNRWYTDEFMETYGHPRCPDGEDCEPMSDKQVRYSHVRILENTPARAVVHWRYALSEVEKYGIADSPTPRGWGDWADEYWTVYPDGIAVRRSVLWSAAVERDKAEFQESIVLIPPGETPEDSLHFDALTFANLAGQTSTYGWKPKTEKGLALPQGPKSFPEPKDAVIQWVNLKSDWKPFEVAWGDHVTFDAYNGEKSISSFEWWNHWPVAQIASSGRPALAADRAGHTSVSHIYWPIYEQNQQNISKILMTGLTQSSAAELVPIAASWRNPARLELDNGVEVPYDAAQRAYVLPAGDRRELRLTLHASAASPAVHPAFVVPGWQGPAALKVISGADSSVQPRYGYLDELSDSRLVIYLPITATGDVVLELSPK